MKPQKKRVFISFDPSMAGSLRAGMADFIMNSTEEIDYDVINLEYLLEVGDISNVPFSSANLYSDLLCDEADNIAKEVNDSLKKLQSYGNDSDVELFVLSNIGNDICNLYYFAEEFKRFNNAKVHYCHIELIKTSSPFLESYMAVDNTIELTAEVLERFSAKWKELVSNNLAVRTCKNGDLVEYSLEQASDMVLSVFTKEYEKLMILYSKFSDSLSKDEKWTFHSFEYIAYMLTKNGVVEKTMDTNTYPCYRDIFFEQKFRTV